MKKFVQNFVPAVALTTLCAMAAHAETTDGKTIAVSAGWAHIMPQGEKQGVNEFYTQYQRNNFNAASGFDLEKTDTAEFKVDYLVNDNVSLGLVVGVPPKFDIKGEGKLLAGALNLDNFSKVGTIKAYSPVLIGKYHFGSVSNVFRPYAGAGVMYAHFSDFQLDGAVSNDVTKKGMAITNVKVKDAVAPVAFIGADYNLTKDLFLTASVSYVHLNTRASLDINNKATGATVVKGSTRIQVDPIVTYLGFGYRF
ncbi:OmpW/AlkL family protein [Acinetobacter rathckeae]|uniref:OmpW/AlkL family protein n=1 Tax=Acinetobacter rathckeae TaxID=2605272 RepID=UPI0018A2B160|nr:OmpW family outer membrane protein [Acinetobacter rathckeae]MBF7686889.1 OmpW family protein [Acinetobacter rathckeae]MBF7694707.1 OmpW family protein [Acinetobacter rathckeae]